MTDNFEVVFTIYSVIYVVSLVIAIEIYEKLEKNNPMMLARNEELVMLMMQNFVLLGMPFFFVSFVNMVTSILETIILIIIIISDLIELSKSILEIIRDKIQEIINKVVKRLHGETDTTKKASEKEKEAEKKASEKEKEAEKPVTNERKNALVTISIRGVGTGLGVITLLFISISGVAGLGIIIVNCILYVIQFTC